MCKAGVQYTHIVFTKRKRSNSDANLLKIYAPSRQLRSSADTCTLHIPSVQIQNTRDANLLKIYAPSCQYTPKYYHTTHTYIYTAA